MRPSAQCHRRVAPGMCPRAGQESKAHLSVINQTTVHLCWLPERQLRHALSDPRGSCHTLSQHPLPSLHVGAMGEALAELSAWPRMEDSPPNSPGSRSGSVRPQRRPEVQPRPRTWKGQGSRVSPRFRHILRAPLSQTCW